MRRDVGAGDEKAVSEAISYVLVFGLITMAVAMITFHATPALESAEQSQVDENAEMAAELVRERVNGMTERDAPMRSLTLNSEDLSVGVGGIGSTMFNVTVYGDGGSTAFETTSQPIYLETDFRTLAYENGAVLTGRQDVEDSWLILEEPSLAVSTNESGYVTTAFVRSISTYGSSEVSGAGNHRIVFEDAGEANENIRDVGRLNITVTSPRYRAWGSYFSDINESINGSAYHESGAGLADDQIQLEIREFNGTGRVSYDETVLQTRVE